MRTVNARLTEPAGPSDGRTTFLTSRLRPGADGVLEATPTERQGSHLTGALGQSDGFAIAPHGSGPAARRRAGRCGSVRLARAGSAAASCSSTALTSSCC